MYQKVNKGEAEHYFWGNNCDSWVFVENNNLSIKLESMPSGARENLHYHTKASQFFFILKGEAVFHINNAKVVVAQQEGILVSPETPHYIENTTDLQIDFLVISQPTTSGDRIVILEEE